jgi:hypothetical protein
VTKTFYLCYNYHPTIKTNKNRIESEKLLDETSCIGIQKVHTEKESKR